MINELKLKKIIWLLVKISLVLVLFAPLIISTNFYFPYIVPRNLWFRFFVNISFFSYLFLIFRYQEFKPRFNKAFILFLAFILTLTLSSLLAGSFSFSFWSNFERMDGLLNWLYLAMYSFVFVGVLQHKPENVLTIFKIALLPAILVAIVAVAQKLNISFVLASAGGERLASTFGNAAYVGSYMFLHILVAFYLLVKDKANRYWQAGYILSILLFVWTLMATDTRGAFLGLLLFIFLFCIFYLVLQKQKKDKIYFTVLSLLIVSIVFVSLLFIQKGSTWIKAVPIFNKISQISLADTTTQSRLLIWRNSWQGVLEKPVFGWGEENFPEVFNKYFPIEIFHDIGSETWFDRPHNILIQHLLHGGFVALLLYLSIFAYLIFSLFKNYRKERDWFTFSFWTAFLLSFLFHDLFIFDSLNTNVILYLLLAYLFGLNAKACEFKFKLPRFVTLILVLLFFIFGHFFVYLPFAGNKLLINSLKTFSSAQSAEDLERVLELWQKSYDISPLGDKEKVQNLQRLTSQVVQAQGIDNTIKAKFVEKTNTHFEILLNKYPQDLRFALFASGFYYDFTPYDPSFAGKNLALLNKAKDLAPDKPELYFSLTNAYLAAGDFEAAQNTAMILTQLAPWAKGAHWNLFKVSASMDDQETVIASLDNIKNINVQNKEANFNTQELAQLEYVINYAKEANPELATLLENYLAQL